MVDEVFVPLLPEPGSTERSRRDAERRARDRGFGGGAPGVRNDALFPSPEFLPPVPPIVFEQPAATVTQVVRPPFALAGALVIGAAILIERLVRRRQEQAIEDILEGQANVLKIKLQRRARERELRTITLPPLPQFDPQPDEPLIVSPQLLPQPTTPRVDVDVDVQTPIEIPTSVPVPVVQPAPVEIPAPVALPLPAPVPSPVGVPLPTPSPIGIPAPVPFPRPFPRIFPLPLVFPIPLVSPRPLTTPVPRVIAPPVPVPIPIPVPVPQPQPFPLPNVAGPQRCPPCKKKKPKRRKKCFKGLFTERHLSMKKTRWDQIDCVTGREI